MDFYKRQLAPLPTEAWEEIDDTARQILKGNLSARKVVDVSGPHGIGHAAVPLGRLNVPEGQAENQVSYGIHKVQPLLETRIPFDLDLWEMDNAVRGAEDIDLEPLEEAAKKIASFEEEAIYRGFEGACIVGLLDSLELDPVPFVAEPAELVGSVATAADVLERQGIEGPYSLVINPDLWSDLLRRSKGYPLGRHLSAVINGTTAFSPLVEGALVLSSRGGDAILTLGHDIGIGYMTHDTRSVRLFLTESFSFRVVEPKFGVKLVKK